MRRIGIIGAGGWGTALAVLAAGRGLRVRLWARDPRLATLVSSTRRNERYLPGVVVPDEVAISTDLAWASDADIVLLAVPSAGLLEVARGIPRERRVVSCAKGLADGGSRLCQALGAQGFRGPGVLSGPNHAEEIGRGLPAASVCASEDSSLAGLVQAALSGGTLRVYTSDDVAGVELGGALKNVVALAAGLADGMGLGDNAKAAVVTRGLREMARFATAHGAREETLYGLSGAGDLVATCGSPHSRNRAAGERLARDEPPEVGGKVAEGITTAARAVAWARASGIEMPLAEAVNDVVHGRMAAADALDRLMSRALRAETD